MSVPNMSVPQKNPVLICGAGPVGLALAIGLARCGVRSIVLEKKAAPNLHSRALGILPRTLEIFRAWSILDAFLEAGTFLTHPSVWAQGKEEPVTSLDFRALKQFTATPGGLILPQDQTERLLLAEVLRCGYSEVRFGRELQGFETDADGVTAQIISEGEEYSLRGSFLVGCDGARSKVRHLLGWELQGKTYPSRFLLADIHLDDTRDALPWPRIAPMPVGVLAALRYAPGKWRIIHTLPPAIKDGQAMGAEYISSLVQQLFGAAGDGSAQYSEIWSSVFRVHCRRSPHFVKDRVILAGDAAHINSPAGGQGMNSGIQDAHNLAWKLAAALRGGDTTRLLASYEAERRAAVTQSVERTTDILTRVLLLKNPRLRGWILLGARLALALAPVRARLLQRMGMLDTRYPRSPLFPATTGSGSTLIGTRAPDGVLTRDAETHRLLDLPHPYATLLLFDDGHLPRWHETEISAALSDIQSTEITVVRICARNVPDETAWRDASGEVWKRWKINGPTAALVRPDGIVGWMAVRPTHEELRASVAQALGA